MSGAPSAHSPFRDGFAALSHDPALLAAELTWRWCFGLAAWGLVTVAAAWFLASLKISPRDEFLLTAWPRLLWQNAVHHVLHGSLQRFVLQQGVLLLGATLLWCLAATAGRAATLRRLVAMFRDPGDDNPEDLDDEMRWHFASIFSLQLARAVWSLLAVAVAVGSLMAGMVMAAEQRGFAALAFFIFGIGLAGGCGATLNWFFGLAPLFCIRNGVGASEALAQTVDFSARCKGRLALLGLEFRVLRAVWGGTMFLALLSLVGLARVLPIGWWLLVCAVVALLYFAGADMFYLARLAAYTSLAEDDARPIAAVELSPLPEPVFGPEGAPAVSST